jgi:hypothetical protein
VRCRAVLSSVLLFSFSASLWGQDAAQAQKLSTRIENEAALLESFSRELKLNAEQVKNLQDLLAKADLSLNEWKNLSEERRKEYLALLQDYESMRKKLRNLRLYWILTGAAAFAAGLLTGALID